MRNNLTVPCAFFYQELYELRKASFNQFLDLGGVWKWNRRDFKYLISFVQVHLALRELCRLMSKSNFLFYLFTFMVSELKETTRRKVLEIDRRWAHASNYFKTFGVECEVELEKMQSKHTIISSNYCFGLKMKSNDVICD